jgi:uncharacterized protein (TIGR02466 family)
MEIFSILPSFYAKDSINRKFTEEELKCVEYHANRTYKNTGNVTSVDKRVLDTEFLDIRNKIDEMLNEYTSTIICPASKNFKLKITQSWINYTDSGQFHHSHSHPNSIISGVLYFNAEDSDRIEFYSDKPQQLKIPSKSPNPFNSESWWVPVKTGDIILFPSYQRHSVPNTTSSNTRISLSFNTFVDGDLGSEQYLTHLSVKLN